MTGLQLAETIHDLRPTLAVILATGYAELPPGADPALGRLAKPFTQAELAEAVAGRWWARAVLKRLVGLAERGVSECWRARFLGDAPERLTHGGSSPIHRRSPHPASGCGADTISERSFVP